MELTVAQLRTIIATVDDAIIVRIITVLPDGTFVTGLLNSNFEHDRFSKYIDLYADSIQPWHKQQSRR